MAVKMVVSFSSFFALYANGDHSKMGGGKHLSKKSKFGLPVALSPGFKDEA